VGDRGPDWERIEQETKARERERLEAERIAREQQSEMFT